MRTRQGSRGKPVYPHKNPRLLWLNVDGERLLATANLAPGTQVYGERLVTVEGVEFRVWDSFRSKLAAALTKGLKGLPLGDGSLALYLGASTGTTASHISDIIGEGGLLFAVEVAPRVAREFVERVASPRGNVIPIIADARRPDRYPSIFGTVDLVYCDVAQPDQTEIAILNCRKFLRKGGSLLLIIKSRSIDVTKRPKDIFEEEAWKLERAGFKVEQVVELEPFDKDHALTHAVYTLGS